MKNWKKTLIGTVALLVLAAIVISSGGYRNGRPAITYVYSNSMEPLIKVNDAFILWPASHWKTGDIIMYRPQVLNAPYITHRIIGIGESGYITKGDNSPLQIRIAESLK
jgi:signal peptidase